MSQLPMTSFTSTGLYFSSFLFFASALLLVALYYFRWKSDFISLGLWLIAFLGGGLTAWLITNEPLAVVTAIGINLFLVLCLCRLARVISLFGVFFLASMLSSSIYGLIWLYELVMAANHYLNPHWFIYPILLLAEAIFGAVIFFNTIMISWIMLMRYSPLYFRFPRLKKGWEKANISKIQPWVSIHVPCYNEPPEIVIETLNALAHQRYPHFEVIVLDNNTKDPHIWKPLEEHCLQLGERFHFYHIDSLPGAKAGALNACLRLTSPQAELISVIDADYVTQDDFLEKLVGFFNDPKVGFVQSCQDYRDWKYNSYLTACYFEYEVHFNLELSGQNEWDTAYTIGTTCLIRRKALEEAGGWAEWCLTEDSEIAVRIHALGYSGYYLKDPLGYGLIPETFESYKQQRFRWTAGPVQQFQKHWRLYLPWFSEGRLTFAQKMGEIFHSLSVFFSEFLNLLVIVPLLGICLWFNITRNQSFILPIVILFLIPIAFLRNIICNYLSIRLLGGNWKNYIWAALAARSLTLTRNVAFYKALLTNKLLWQRTDKFKASTSFWRAFSSSRSEMIAGSIYILLASFLAYFVQFTHPDLIFLIWLGIVNRAISFFCAPMMALLSEKNLN
jgi:cellulose synthase/poly-beta-1,6-N-acetylglucosamine synthase-like glycosyltransferase